MSNQDEVQANNEERDEELRAVKDEADHVGLGDIDNFDFDRASMLMGIMEKVSNIAPKNTAILGLAVTALNKMNEEAMEIARKRAEAFARLATRQAELLAAQQREQAEAEREDAIDSGEVEVRPRAIPSRTFERPDPTPGQPRPPITPKPAPETTGRRV
jgi:hypothetical protein